MIPFSIIVPVYNVEQYLSQCIDSILNQTFTHFELIIVNDGSTDNSPSICDNYSKKDERIKVIHKKNGGLSSARNEGLKISNSEYILFVDSDDWIELNTLEKLNQVIKYQPDIVVFSFNYYYNSTTIIKNKKINTANNIISKNEYLEYIVKNRSFNQCIACNKAYKLSIIKNNNLYFIEGILNEDGPFTLSIINYVKDIYIIDDYFYNYRKGREDAITYKNSIKNFDSLYIGVISTIKRIGLNNKYSNSILLYIILFSISQTYNNKHDYLMIVKKSSSTEYKLLILKLLYNSKYTLNLLLLSFFALISPRLLNYLAKKNSQIKRK